MSLEFFLVVDELKKERIFFDRFLFLTIFFFLLVLKSPILSRSVNFFFGEMIGDQNFRFRVLKTKFFLEIEIQFFGTDSDFFTTSVSKSDSCVRR